MLVHNISHVPNSCVYGTSPLSSLPTSSSTRRNSSACSSVASTLALVSAYQAAESCVRARGRRRRGRIARPSPRAGSGSSRTLRPNEEEPRDARHPPRRHRVGPPPVVRFSLAGLDHLRLPAVLGKQRLRVIGAEAARST